MRGINSGTLIAMWYAKPAVKAGKKRKFMSAVSAPAPKAEDKYRNPAATITKEEMGPEAAKYVDDYRKARRP